MSEEKNLEGIGGWLILVAIGVVISPFRIMLLMITTYPELFSSGAWEVLTTPASEVYNPLWAPIIVGEILVNICLIFAWIYTAYLFFTKQEIFPMWYISLIIFSLFFIVADALAVKLVLPEEPIFDPETTKELVRSIVVASIWVPYMLVSKRVKATFKNMVVEPQVETQED